MRFRPFVVPVWTLFATGFAAAQLPQLSLPPGFASRIVYRDQGGPFGHTGFAMHPWKDVLFVVEQNEIVAVDARMARTLVFKTPGRHIGLCKVAKTSGELLFTDFSKNRLYRRSLSSNRQSSLAIPKNVYDLVQRGTVLLANANPNWPGANAHCGVWLLDSTGKHRQVIQLTGPSGPLALDTNGDVLCALMPAGSPMPKNSVQVLRFPSKAIDAALASNKPIDAKVATVVASKLAGASAIVVDDRRRVLVCDAVRGDLLRIEASGAVTKQWIGSKGRGTTHLLFREGSRTGTLDGFQPADSAQLFVATTDWLMSYEVHAIAPLRPRLSSNPTGTVRPGSLKLHADHAPVSAPILLAVSAARTTSSRIAFWHLGQPMHLTIDLRQPLFFLHGKTDGRGVGTIQTTLPRLPLRLTAQALIGTNSGAASIGTSNPLTLNIRP